MLLKYMNSSLDSYPSIQICSLGVAKEIDHSTYDGVITIEDSFDDFYLLFILDIGFEYE